MLSFIFACTIAVAAAAPATYDQRQDGDFNVRADVQNVVLLVALPQKTQIPSGLLDFFKSTKPGRAAPAGLQERADVQLMEAFVEPSTPYRVEIGSSERFEGDGRAVEVVIAGRRRQNSDTQAEGDEIKLLGATEQCGPDRERDPVTLSCRARTQPEDEPTADVKPESAIQPEVVPVS